MAANFFQPGFDEQTENQNIERQRQYAQLLRQQSEQSPQASMVSGHYVAPSFTQGLAQMLKAYQGGKSMREADARQKALAEAVRGRQTEELGKFTGLMNGRPAEQLPEDQFGPARPAEKPDLAAAYQYAAGAKTPGLQQVGLTGAMQMAQDRAKQEQAAAQQQRVLGIIQSAGSPQAAIAAGAPPEMVKQFYESKNYGRDEVTFQDVGGEKVPVTKFGDRPEGIAPLQKTGNPFSDVVVRDPKTGEIVPNAPLVAVKGQIAEKGAARTSLTVNAGPKAFETELGKLDAKQLDEWRTKAEQASSSLSTAQRLRDAETQGAFSGALADQKLAAASLINGITGVTPKGLVGSQLYNAEASKLVLDHIKGLGANPSNADREFIEKTVPRLATSKEARTAMVNFIERSSQRTIQTYQEMDGYARKNSGLGGYQMPVPTAPEKTAAPASSNGITIRRLD